MNPTNRAPITVLPLNPSSNWGAESLAALLLGFGLDLLPYLRYLIFFRHATESPFS